MPGVITSVDPARDQHGTLWRARYEYLRQIKANQVAALTNAIRAWMDLDELKRKYFRPNEAERKRIAELRQLAIDLSERALL